MPSEGEDYLASALAIMEGKALHRDNINWAAVRAEASRRAIGASSPAETYDAIRWALSQLQDDHSFFDPPDCGSAAIASGQYQGEVTMPDGHLRADRFIWTKTADEILASLARFCGRISDSGD